MSLLQKSKDAECTPVMFSTAAKAARATGRAVKRAVEITGEAAVETAKDAALNTIKKGPKNAGARSTSGGARRQQLQRTRGMSGRDKAIEILKEQKQQEKKNEQTEALRWQHKQEKERRKQSAAAYREMVRL